MKLEVKYYECVVFRFLLSTRYCGILLRSFQRLKLENLKKKYLNYINSRSGRCLCFWYRNVEKNTTTEKAFFSFHLQYLSVVFLNYVYPVENNKRNDNEDCNENKNINIMKATTLKSIKFPQRLATKLKNYLPININWHDYATYKHNPNTRGPSLIGS